MTAPLPFDLVNRLDGQIVRQLGNGRVEFAREFGSFSAHKNLKSVYTMFVEQAGGDPQSLMEELASLHSNFYDWGSMRALRVGEGRCRVQVDYSGAASRSNCQTAIGFYAEAPRLLGIAGPGYARCPARPRARCCVPTS